MKQPNSIEDFFLDSNGQSPNLAVGDHWLKVSRTPGRNLDNGSVLLEDASMVKSHLAITYPLGEDADSDEETTADEDLFFGLSHKTSIFTIDGRLLKTSLQAAISNRSYPRMLQLSSHPSPLLIL